MRTATATELLDGEEVAAGANPTVSDTDGDGIPDNIEIKYPKACIAADNFSQRRPAPVCTSDADCVSRRDLQGTQPEQQTTATVTAFPMARKT
jgi:hypothetical protein